MELAQAFSITRSTAKATSRTCSFGGLGGNGEERQLGSGQPYLNVNSTLAPRQPTQSITAQDKIFFASSDVENPAKPSSSPQLPVLASSFPLGQECTSSASRCRLVSPSRVVSLVHERFTT